jgi:hypothetical protein
MVINGSLRVLRWFTVTESVNLTSQIDIRAVRVGTAGAEPWDPNMLQNTPKNGRGVRRNEMQTAMFADFTRAPAS